MANKKRNEKNSKVASVVGSAAGLTVSKVVILAISLITSILLSRFSSLEEYGTYSEILLVVNLAVSIIMLGLPNSLNYFLPRADTDENRDTFLSTYYTATTILSAICGFILVVAIPLIIVYFDNPGISTYTYVLAVLPWAKVIINGRSNMLVATNNVKREIVYSICYSICSLGIILLVQVADRDFSFYMCLYIMLEAAYSIAVYFEAKKITKRFQVKINWNLLKQILIFSIPLGLSTALGTLCTEIDKLMIGWFYDTEKVAIYTNAAKELPLVYISSSFTSVLMPRVVKYIKDNKKGLALDLWKKSAEFCFIIMSLFALGCFVFAPQVITILYSSKYIEGTGIFRIYSLTLLCRITYWGMILNGYGKTKDILYNSLLSLVLNVVLNYICYLVFGFIGPALATLISLLSTCAFQLNRTSKCVDVKMRYLLPWKNMAKILGISLLLSVIFAFISRVINLSTDTMSLVIAVFLGVIWSIVYALLMRKRIKNLVHDINKL